MTAQQIPVALITGAGAGIGATFAAALAEDGMHVAVTDLDGGAAEEVADSIRKAGGRASAHAMDVRDSVAVDEVVAAVLTARDRIDVLVNNAGLHLERYARPCTELTDDAWTALLDVNVLGIVRCTRAVVGAFSRGGGGTVVNQASASAYRLGSAYSVSKLAVVGLTTALAKELAPRNIRVNAIAPGLVDSPAALAELSEERRTRLVDQQTINRPGTMDDLVGTLRYLTSDASKFMTGQTILVDGGLASRL